MCDKNVFEDIKEKLSFGLLYFSYYNPSFSDESLRRHQTLTLPSLLTHMFPITVRDIRPGTISGDERIITLHSGTYGFAESSDHNSSHGQSTTGRLFCYRRDGAALAMKSVQAAGGNFAVTVPVDGACVLERAVQQSHDQPCTSVKSDDDEAQQQRVKSGYRTPWWPNRR